MTTRPIHQLQLPILPLLTFYDSPSQLYLNLGSKEKISATHIRPTHRTIPVRDFGLQQKVFPSFVHTELCHQVIHSLHQILVVQLKSQLTNADGYAVWI